MKVVSLISGGIDSPVATYFALKQGAEAVVLHCGGSELVLDKVKKNVENLRKYGKCELYVVDFDSVQKEIFEKCNKKYMCVLCKRFMYRAAEALAHEVNASMIITGENIGQVASQTLDNMIVIDGAVKMKVIRPLVAMDKQEIVDVAEKIGTYDTSIIQGGGCAYVPNSPSTMAREEAIAHEESELDVDKIIKKIIKEKRKI